MSYIISDVASIGARGGAECHPDREKVAKNQDKSGKNWEKRKQNREKSGRKGKNRDDSFTLPLLTERAGYATVYNVNRSASFIKQKQPN